VHIWDLTGSFTLDSHISNGLKSLLMSLQINEQDVPMDFVCPITSEIMTDPVLCEDGFSYERSAIETWFSKDKRTSPMTNMVKIISMQTRACHSCVIFSHTGIDDN
jgi:hypothetical protein